MLLSAPPRLPLFFFFDFNVSFLYATISPIPSIFLFALFVCAFPLLYRPSTLSLGVADTRESLFCVCNFSSLHSGQANCSVLMRDSCCTTRRSWNVSICVCIGTHPPDSHLVSLMICFLSFFFFFWHPTPPPSSLRPPRCCWTNVWEGR
jgi:hypothetical protein